MTEHKTVFVPADFRDKIKEVVVYDDDRDNSALRRLWQKPTSPSRVVEKVVGKLDGDVDGEKLAADLAAAIQQLEREGFRVVHVLPITSGDYDYSSMNDSSYGYSYTGGLMVVAERQMGGAA